jgi:hypothetical protein
MRKKGREKGREIVERKFRITRVKNKKKKKNREY